ncbi:MAG: histidine kinase [Clostridia bacterium]|nr:histidine kinase [Clostridia bacterium]
MDKKSKLLRRIAMPYFIMLTVIISVSMVIVYTSFITRAEGDAAIATHRLADRTAGQMRTYIDELIVLADQVNHQPIVINTFHELSADNDKGNSFEDDVLRSIEVSSALNALIMKRTTDYNISVYNGSGDFISSQTYLIDEAALKKSLADMDYKAELKRIEESGGTVILPPERNIRTSSEDEYITVMTALKNDYSDTAYGIIEVRGSLKMLDAMLKPEGQESDIFIRDRETGAIIYPSGFVYNENESDYAAAAVKDTEWEAAISYTQPKGYGIRIFIIFFIIYILLLGFLFFISHVIGISIITPIVRLSRRIKDINDPDEEIDLVEEQAIDEIKDLENSFLNMLERVNNSLRQEKRAYSLALQAQMNPHFLYNSLAVIGAAGAESGCETVSDMCIELSDMLRYVTAYERITVPLKDEIAHTENYLSLMKSRYEDNFSYTIDVSEELLNMAVPKLFIQPLAENCFKHSFRDVSPPWSISIKMTGTPRSWELVIKDNGTGITEEKIAEITDRIEAAAESMSLSGVGGLGIVNTVVRLKMTHSKHIKYSMYNDNGMGIKIAVFDE